MCMFRTWSAPDLMVWGLGQPGADHWRQWSVYARPIGPKRGRNVTKLRISKGAPVRERLAPTGVLVNHDGVVEKGVDVRGRTAAVRRASPVLQGRGVTVPPPEAVRRLRPARAQHHPQPLWPQGRRRRMARLRPRFPQGPRAVLGL